MAFTTGEFLKSLELFYKTLKMKNLDPIKYIGVNFDVKFRNKKKIEFDNYSLFKGIDFLIISGKKIREELTNLVNGKEKDINDFLVDIACYHYSFLNFLQSCLKKDSDLAPVVNIDPALLYDELIESASFFSSLPQIENDKFPNKAEFRKKLIMRLENENNSSENLGKNLKIINMFKELIQFINQMDIIDPGQQMTIESNEALFRYRILIEMMLEKPSFKIDILNNNIHRFQ